MRYAEYVAGTEIPAPGGGARTARRTVERLADAVHEQRFWVLSRHPESSETSNTSATSWTLHELDDTTGVLGPAVYTSPELGADPAVAMDWAADLVEVDGWTDFTDDGAAYIDELHRIITDLTWRDHPGRSLMLRLEDDPHTPGLQLVVARQQWSSGRISTPLHTCERSVFPDTQTLLDWASERFGVDRAGWVSSAGGRDHHHG
jgi:hypothetical protein